MVEGDDWMPYWKTGEQYLPRSAELSRDYEEELGKLSDAKQDGEIPLNW